MILYKKHFLWAKHFSMCFMAINSFNSYNTCMKQVLLFFFINLFIFGCVGSSLLHVGFLQLWRAGATLRCGVWASHGSGFSCCRARALVAWASVVVACGLSNCGSQALERRLSSCGTWAQLLRCMWDLPGPGLEPVSPALAGGFLTTALPRKPSRYYYYYHVTGKKICQNGQVSFPKVTQVEKEVPGFKCQQCPSRVCF